MSDNPKPVIPGEIPSAWQAYGPILAGAARVILGALGAAGFTWAQAVTGSQIEMAVSVSMVVAAAVWSAWQKIQAARASRRLATAAAVQSAVATAAAGQPVAIIPATPPPPTVIAENVAELHRLTGP